MAKLPGYDSQQQMGTAAPGQMRDMAQEQQMGANIAGLGKVARDLALVWQEAEDFQQTLAKQNQLDDGTRSIIKRAEEDPDYRRSGGYEADLEDLRSASLDGFTNNLARNKFAVTANGQIGAAKIKADGIKRAGLLKDTEADIAKAYEHQKNAYIKSGDPAAKDKMNGIIQAALEKGIYDPVKAAKLEVAIGDWDQYRFLQIAMGDENTIGDPALALQMIDESDMQPSEKNAAKAAILTTARQGAIIQEIEGINRENQLYFETNEYLDDQEKSYVDKLDFIQQQEDRGLPTARANKLKKELYSEEKVNATTHTKAMEFIIRRTEGLKKRITDDDKNKKDVKQFLLEVQSVQDLITDARAAGKITQGDKKLLVKDLADITQAQKAISAGVIKEEKGAMWFADWFVYGYDDAYKKFDEAFGDLPDLPEEALVELYTQSKAHGYTPHQMKRETTNIIDTYKNRLRAETEEMIKNRTGARFTPEGPVSDDDFLKSIDWTDETIQQVIDTNPEITTREQAIQAARDKLGQ